MIIIEGADLVGKTTLVKAIVDDLRVRYGTTFASCHLGRLGDRGDRRFEYTRLLSQHQVWDRFHLSELAYRACDESPTIITPVKYAMVDRVLQREYLFRMAVLLASEDTIRQRHAAKGDDVYSLDHIIKINETFSDIVQTSQTLGFRVRDMIFYPVIHEVLYSEPLECPIALKETVEKLVDRVMAPHLSMCAR